MKPRQRLLLYAGAGLLLVIVVVSWWRSRDQPLVLSGIVTTGDVVVSPQVGGQVGKLLVTEGDAVTKGQLLAVITPAELAADQAYYAHSAEGTKGDVRQSAAALRFEERQASERVKEAQANLAAAIARQSEALATRDESKRNYDRVVVLAKDGVTTGQEVDAAKTSFAVAQARYDAAQKQVEAQRATLALAQSNTDQVAMQREALGAAKQRQAGAAAQATKANVRLAYTELHAPVAGIVDVRAVRQGEFVNAGQPVVTIINPDDLWVRADIEETYVERVRIGDTLTVRLPSGQERKGVVFYRGADAAFATARDVSRTKRDVRTFEIRLRVDNTDRRLAVGMTAQVLFAPGGTK
ncbi:MAG: efflux RND transporter periplasmic adaptor subunit [Gemmatimonadota bacterium]